MRKLFILVALVSTHAWGSIHLGRVREEMKTIESLKSLQCDMDPLGEGAYGIVLKCNDHGNTIAVKVTQVFEEGGTSLSKNNLREKFILESTRGAPHLVSSLWTVVTVHHYYHALEYHPDNLFDQIIFARDNNQLSSLRPKIPQLISALQELHQIGIIHRDIKPSNILVDQNGVLKLTDYGASRNCSPQIDNRSLTPTIHRTTSWYLPLEAIYNQKKNYCREVDYWSLGCVIGQMIIGEPLFPSQGRNQKQEMIDLTKRVFSALGAPNEFVLNSNSFFLIDLADEAPPPRTASQYLRSISKEEIDVETEKLLDSLLNIDDRKRNLDRVLENFPLSQKSQAFIDNLKLRKLAPSPHISNWPASPQISAQDKLEFLDNFFYKLYKTYKTAEFHFLSTMIDSVLGLDSKLTKEEVQLALASAFFISDTLIDYNNLDFDLDNMLNFFKFKKSRLEYQKMISRQISLLSNLYPNPTLPFYLLRERQFQLPQKTFEIADFYLELLNFGSPPLLSQQEIVDTVIELADELARPKLFLQRSENAQTLFIKLKTNLFALETIDSNFLKFYSQTNPELLSNVSTLFREPSPEPFIEQSRESLKPPIEKFKRWYPKKSFSEKFKESHRGIL